MTTFLLVGSLIFEEWVGLKGFVPNDKVTNLAVGGTTTEYWINNLGQAAGAEPVDAVLLYCGSNDLNENIHDTEIISNVLRCAEIVHEQVPTAAFAYFSIIKAPQKIGKWKLIDRINAVIRTSLPIGDLFVETNNVFFRDGSPVEYFFIDDGLHLTSEAYLTLSAYVQPIISNWFRENGNPKV
ncbi:MAG: SGNH/GDSL hydrolase family protein [Anaerolineae bacterium]|nr:SGNH/GDSL hydrolase family protein [Anaerolineae bacterium]